ncbi:MAG: two-component system, response regulator PdtaR [Gaiellaceae bacterium]|jgi:response regulator NasT|nr:two-component system, response regulator PdtaR [Gaiellaceae bacterium]
MTAGAPARILTVEDDPIVRADLRLILEDHGFDVCAAARDGVEAVELAREHRPDLILIDLNLPQLDGVEATRRILDEREVPIVALTGYVAGDSIQRAVEAGAVDHVTKPFSEAGLVETLRDVLASRKLELEREAEHHSIRVVIESMLREHRTEEEILAVVHSMTGESAPPGELSAALRRVVARLRGLFSAPSEQRKEP